jgi:hypothetical protein
MAIKACRQCKAEFDVSNSDLAFYDRMSPVFLGKKYQIPAPQLCPACREQHRFSFRNEWSLYHGKCGLTEKPMITLYSPEKPYKVYEQSVWWSDQFDGLDYGRDFDFSRPFFEQWHDLSLAVPRVSIHNSKSENSEYTNYSAENKNCFMTVGAVENEDIYFSYRPSLCKSLVDCYDSYKCELCYEITDCRELYGCKWCNQCHNSRNLTLCSFCNACQDCFGCVNLRQKKFHIFNQPYSPEEYHQKVETLLEDLESAKKQFEEFRLTKPCCAVDLLSCEASSGDRLIDCKKCENVFLFKNSEECSDSSFGINSTSCFDSNYANSCELTLFSSNMVKDYNVIFSNLAWHASDSMYVTSCFNSSNLFGCIGLKKNQHCVFNKQYSKVDYESLVSKIIEHMQVTGEWGEYFPPRYSPFDYNETAAQDYHPLTKSEVLELGWRWHEQEEGSQGGKSIIPKTSDATDDLVKQVLYCSVTGKAYKIIPQELRFYREQNLPIPTKCPDQRRRERMASRNPHRLFNRVCGKCNSSISSSYAPSRPEIVFCEKCYLEEVYTE